MHATLIAFAEAFVVLFVIVHPLGVAPVFAAYTAGLGVDQRRAMLRRVVLIVGITLIGFAVLAEPLLHAFGLSIEALQIAGGVLTGVAGFRMVTATDQILDPPLTNREDPSLMPLAIPLLAGPGAMAVLLGLESRQADVWRSMPGTIAAILVICGCVYACLGAGDLIGRKLGRGGLAALTLVFGLSVTSLGVEMIVHGITTHGAFVED